MGGQLVRESKVPWDHYVHRPPNVSGIGASRSLFGGTWLLFEGGWVVLVFTR